MPEVRKPGKASYAVGPCRFAERSRPELLLENPEFLNPANITARDPAASAIRALRYYCFGPMKY
ncbi:hypothetical protein PROAA_1220006 [Candidatus Propionivibrio aalborgensis]|uniref:Uncharacterized protein n=1 Tax=Candidatus Propionivibrio aalborgensis TaxID=1860101 RepID=A0A1A8XG15_9RHOO|nr:hypothetical protein PROAA_1220006 [Candidatus Propionivibrio aalborgensis]